MVRVLRYGDFIGKVRVIQLRMVFGVFICMGIYRIFVIFVILEF